MKAIESNRKAESAFRRGDYKGALELYGEALRIDRSIENMDGAAINLIGMAAAYRKTGDVENALRRLDEISGAGERNLSEAALMKALIFIDRGKYDDSSAWAEKALVSCLNIKCGFEGKIYNLKARIALLKNDPGTAANFGNSGLELNRKYGDDEETANSFRITADARVMAGEFAGAREYYENALAMDKPLGVSRKIVSDLIGIGNTFSGQNRPDQSLRYYQRALTAARNAGDEQVVKDVESKIRDLKLKQK